MFNLWYICTLVHIYNINILTKIKDLYGKLYLALDKLNQKCDEVHRMQLLVEVTPWSVAMSRALQSKIANNSPMMVS